MPQVTQPPPTVHPKGNSRWKQIRHWLYIVKMYIKGIISMSPDSCIFPYKKKRTKIINLRYLGWEAIVISNNLLMFCYMSSFSQQKCLYILAPCLFGRVPQLSERLYPGCKSSEKKRNSQLVGCPFFPQWTGCWGWMYILHVRRIWIGLDGGQEQNAMDWTFVSPLNSYVEL